ncbi:hypothetical protein Kpho02_58340 [Kitasatospora phosalacinea]|uniref:Uncharacterized protein n=1 Tax=Kitasatospora phosalacinea TaxID=2065 RepID=A0A9W6V5W3_9ACTN|nr:hypothetical protein [Kitasatospora phosalacinea]GLW73535.1 hypothetical protein Kpho02_58340 [Kitasatospora phosalacinea]
MGAKTALLAHADGDGPALLRQAVGAAPDRERTGALMDRLYRGWTVEPGGRSRALFEVVYPAPGEAFAGSWPGVDVLCDRRFMLDRPSQLPADLLATGPGRRTVLHAMHSVVDWLAFALWEDGRLVRSLSVTPDDGVIEDLGDPLPFELPYWAGEHPVEPLPEDEGGQLYPLPFHPLSLGEDALHALFGFNAEGHPADVEETGMLPYLVGEPGAAPRAAAAARPHRSQYYLMGPDGRPILIGEPS